MADFQNPNLIPVPVIASFNAEGELRPLYFSVEGLRLKVDNIRFTDKRMCDIIEFRCEVTFIDRVQSVTLRYHKRQGRWMMKRQT